MAVAGVVDAIAYNLEGAPKLVFDWKSDVAPTPDTRHHHAAQIREYLESTGAGRGVIVYMSVGEVSEVYLGTSIVPAAESPSD